MSDRQMSDTMKVGSALVDLCRKNKFVEAVDALYSQGIVSIEAQEMGGMPRRMEGRDAVRGKNQWWEKSHEIHSTQAEGPFPHDDRFVVRYKFDVTAKEGPMAGKRMTLDETALYTVAGGKVVKEEFFYPDM